jgi:DNA-binding protein Fis
MNSQIIESLLGDISPSNKVNIVKSNNKSQNFLSLLGNSDVSEKKVLHQFTGSKKEIDDILVKIQNLVNKKLKNTESVPSVSTKNFYEIKSKIVNYKNGVQKLNILSNDIDNKETFLSEFLFSEISNKTEIQTPYSKEIKSDNSELKFNEEVKTKLFAYLKSNFGFTDTELKNIDIKEIAKTPALSKIISEISDKVSKSDMFSAKVNTLVDKPKLNNGENATANLINFLNNNSLETKKRTEIQTSSVKEIKSDNSELKFNEEVKTKLFAYLKSNFGFTDTELKNIDIKEISKTPALSKIISEISDKVSKSDMFSAKVNTLVDKPKLNNGNNSTANLINTLNNNSLETKNKTEVQTSSVKEIKSDNSELKFNEEVKTKLFSYLKSNFGFTDTELKNIDIKEMTKTPALSKIISEIRDKISKSEMLSGKLNTLGDEPKLNNGEKATANLINTLNNNSLETKNKTEIQTSKAKEIKSDNSELKFNEEVKTKLFSYLKSNFGFTDTELKNIDIKEISKTPALSKIISEISDNVSKSEMLSGKVKNLGDEPKLINGENATANLINTLNNNSLETKNKTEIQTSKAKEIKSDNSELKFNEEVKTKLFSYLKSNFGFTDTELKNIDIKEMAKTPALSKIISEIRDKISKSDMFSAKVNTLGDEPKLNNGENSTANLINSLNNNSLETKNKTEIQTSKAKEIKSDNSELKFNEEVKTKLFSYLKNNFGFTDTELKNIDIKEIAKTPVLSKIFSEISDNVSKSDMFSANLNTLGDEPKLNNGENANNHTEKINNILNSDNELRRIFNDRIETKNNIRNFEIVYQTDSIQPISSETKNKIELLQNYSDIKIKIVKVSNNNNIDIPEKNITNLIENKPDISSKNVKEESNLYVKNKPKETNETTNSSIISALESQKVDNQKEINFEIRESREANNNKLNKISTNFSGDNDLSQNSDNNNQNFSKNFSTGNLNTTTMNTVDKSLDESDKILNYNNIRPEQITKTVTKIINNNQGAGTINARLNLYPKALGRVFVEINISDDNAKISFKVDGKETLKTIENQIGSLKEALKQQGNPDGFSEY